MVGASRERVNKAIALFVRLGWLEVSGRSQYHILDRAELEARALTTAHLISIAFEDVKQVLVHRPDVLWAVVRILARRLRETDEALADAMFLDVTGRTAKRLLALADGDDHFRMPLTQEELAGMVGASRERVNKAIALFVKLGWLEVSGRSQYHILDRAELQARAIS